LFGPNALNAVVGTPDQLNTDGYVSDDVRRTEDRGLTPNMSDVENTVLLFPSNVPGHHNPLVFDLRNRECRLRRAKANDTLGRIREALSGLSYAYINKVRQSVTTRDHLKAYEGVKFLSKEVSLYQQVYNRNSRALAKLDRQVGARYPLLRRSDCTISTAIADVNARGQSQVRLSWLWGAIDGWDGVDQAAQNSMLDNDRLLECTYIWSFARLISNFTYSISLSCQLDESPGSGEPVGGGIAAYGEGDGLDHLVFHAPERRLVSAAPDTSKFA
jgi:hypothetical protein